MNILTLDSEKIFIDKKYLHMSKLLLSATGEENPIIPLYSVTKETMILVLEFMNINYYINDMKLPMPIKNKKILNDIIGPENVIFFKIYKSKIFDLLTAAEYMEIPLLLHLCCAIIAIDIKNYNLYKMRNYFNLIDDFTDIQKKQAYKELKWISTK